MEYLVILVTTFIATALSAMSGGGASIINLPVFLSLGISFPLAVTIQKISSAFWVLLAAYNYLKDRKVDWKFLITFALIGLIGCYLGVLFVIGINQSVLSHGIGVLILFLVVYTYFKKDLGIQEEKVYSKGRQLLAYPFAVILGFYESIFGSGNGILLAMVTFFTKGFDFVDALGHYFAIAFVWVLFAAVLFAEKGYFDLKLTVPAVVGSVLGGYVGSKYAKYKGNSFIRLVFVIIGGMLGLKLILGP